MRNDIELHFRPWFDALEDKQSAMNGHAYEAGWMQREGVFSASLRPAVEHALACWTDAFPAIIFLAAALAPQVEPTESGMKWARREVATGARQ